MAIKQKDAQTKTRYFTLLGKRYGFRRVPYLGNKYRGDCDPPYAINKCIRILSGMSEQDEMTTIIHECLHAADWTKDEEWVNNVSEDIGRILTKLGYCRDDSKI